MSRQLFRLPIKTFKLYIFDADDTLRRCTVPGQPCPNRDGEWEVIPGVRERISELSGEAVVAIASNQGGVGLGFMPMSVAESMLERLWLHVTGVERLPTPHPITLCPHRPDASCSCRKPQPGMLHQLMQRFEATPDETLFVGDQESDRGAARSAGCSFMWAHEFFRRNT